MIVPDRADQFAADWLADAVEIIASATDERLAGRWTSMLFRVADAERVLRTMRTVLPSFHPESALAWAEYERFGDAKRPARGVA